MQYAQWEEGQKDFRRARSVWERALEVTHTNPTAWLKYAEMEMRHRFVNHARNIWDRAVQILPRVDQLWYKYIHMEEMLGNVPGARQVFERWMKWEPDHHGWAAYIKVPPLLCPCCWSLRTTLQHLGQAVGLYGARGYVRTGKGGGGMLAEGRPNLPPCPTPSTTTVALLNSHALLHRHFDLNRSWAQLPVVQASPSAGVQTVGDFFWSVKPYRSDVNESQSCQMHLLLAFMQSFNDCALGVAENGHETPGPTTSCPRKRFAL